MNVDYFTDMFLISMVVFLTANIMTYWDYKRYCRRFHILLEKDLQGTLDPLEAKELDFMING